MQQAMNKFDDWWTEFEDLEAILLHLFPDESSQLAWATMLDGTFPPEPDVTYLEPDWGQHGLKNLRPFHWAFLKAAGNKGPVHQAFALKHHGERVLYRCLPGRH